jgi:hypothetical protein
MPTKKIFVSFDYSNDRHYKNLLAAWDANQSFQFEFEDHSVTTPVNSDASGPIRAVITRKMRESTCCLVIVGRETAKSNWVSWEIENAKALGLGLVAVKVNRVYETPMGLYGTNATWALAFDQAAIVRAVAGCR